MATSFFHSHMLTDSPAVGFFFFFFLFSFSLVRRSPSSSVAAVVVEPGVIDEQDGLCPLAGLFQYSFNLTRQSDRLVIVASRKERPLTLEEALECTPTLPVTR